MLTGEKAGKGKNTTGKGKLTRTGKSNAIFEPFRHKPLTGFKPVAEKITLGLMIFVITFLLLVTPFQRGLYFPEELLSAKVAIFGLLIVWGAFRLTRNEEKIVFSPLEICLLVLLLAYITSFFGAAHRRDALEETLKISSYLVVFLVSLDICRYFRFSLFRVSLPGDRGDQKKNSSVSEVPPGLSIILHIALGATTVVTVASLGAAAGYLDFPGAYVIYRVSSPMGYANTAAAYLMAAYLLALALAPLCRAWYRVLYLVPAALMFMTVILTFSRGAWLLAAPFSVLLVIASAPGQRLRSFCYLLVTAGVATPVAFLVDPFFREQQPEQAWLLIGLLAVVVILLGLLAELYLKQGQKVQIMLAGAGAAAAVTASSFLFIFPALGPVELARGPEESSETRFVEQLVENIAPGEIYRLNFKVKAEKTAVEDELPEFAWGLNVVGIVPGEESVNLVSHRGGATEGWEEVELEFETGQAMSSLEIRILNRYPGTAVTVRDATLDKAGQTEKLGFFLYRALPERFYNRLFTRSLDTNVDRRVELFGDAFKIIRDYPLTGTGGGGWVALYRSYQEQVYHSREVHNHYLQVWVEAGVFGFLAFVGIWISFAVAFVRNCIKGRSTHRKWQYWTAAFLPVAALGGHSIIDWNFSMGAVGIFLFVLLGAGRSLDQLSWFGSSKNTGSVQNRKLIFYLPGLAGLIAGVLLLVYTITLLIGFNATTRAQELLERGAVNSAAAELQKAMQADPLRAENYHQMGILFEDRALRTGDPADIEEMIALAEKAYELEPYNPLYTARYSNLVLRYIDIDLGLEHFDRIVELRPLTEDSYIQPTSIRLNLAEHFIDQGNRFTAERHLEEVLAFKQLMEENYGDIKPILYNLGRAHFLLRNYDSARDYYERIEEDDRNYDRAQSDLEEMRR